MPTDTALAAYNQSNFGPGNASRWQDAILSYHIGRGLRSYQTLNSGGTWQTIWTLLSDPDYANVTGGQVITVESRNGSAVVISANQATSNVVEHVRCGRPQGSGSLVVG